MASKQVIFEGTVLSGMGTELTARQREAVAQQMAQFPGCVTKIWQRAAKGWLAVEIEISEHEHYKFRVDHRAQVSNVRIERSASQITDYQRKAEADPRRHWAKLLDLQGARHERKLRGG